MKQKILVEVVCMLLIFLFVYTGASKLYERNLFEIQLHMFPYINHFSTIISWLIPLAELVTALLIVIRKFRSIGLYMSLALLISFTCYISGMVVMTKDLPCPCGGIISKLSWKQHILFNILFIVLTSIAISLKGNNQRTNKSEY